LLLRDIYDAAVAAVAPGPALARAIEADAIDDRVWIVALGKAAAPMAAAAVRVLEDRGQAPAGGLIVAPDTAASPHPSIEAATGDHPEPDAQSLASAEALARLTGRIGADDAVWVLLSGGTTSLIGAPQPGISLDELKTLYAQLLRSGLEIAMMNRIRKRFTRWGAGRLARGLAHAKAVRCYIISDVIGDDLAAIGSGPCVPDPTTAANVREGLVRAGLWDDLAASLRRHVEAGERGVVPETPKPGDPAFSRVANHLIATNRMALDGAARRASELGLIAQIVEPPIVGEAAAAGATLGDALVARHRSTQREPTHCLILGGETTVTIRNQDAGQGGRCQELALAAAHVLRGMPPSIGLLAAGTDGRDGPTDAAGAIVDGTTWDRIAAAGRDPQRDLLRHDAYGALAAADALVRTGPTGTNVMDVIVGLR
jgi:glycerate 2-kinase